MSYRHAKVAIILVQLNLKMTLRLKSKFSTVNYREEAISKREGRAETRSGAKPPPRLTADRKDTTSMEK